MRHDPRALALRQCRRGDRAPDVLDPVSDRGRGENVVAAGEPGTAGAVGHPQMGELKAMNCGRLTYSVAKGEGKLTVNMDFCKMHPVVKLDVLIDWMADIEALYEVAHRECYPKAYTDANTVANTETVNGDDEH